MSITNDDLLVARYALILKQDGRRLKYLLSQAQRSGPLPSLNFIDSIEITMVNTAPDIGALMFYDFYSPSSPSSSSSSSDQDAVSNNGTNTNHDDDYSIVTHLFASLRAALT